MPTQRLRISLLVIVTLLLLTACGQQFSPLAQPTAAPSPVVPVLAVSELALGPNRIVIGLLKDGTPLNDPTLELGMRFFYLDLPLTAAVGV